MHKKSFCKALSLFLVVTFAFAALLTGCSQPSAPSGTGEGTTKTEATTQQEKVTIRVLTRYSGTDATTPIFQEMIKDFMDKYPNIIVQDDSVNEPTAYDNKLRTGLATGDLPNIWYPVTGTLSTAEYAKNGIIMEISEMMEDKEWFDGFIKGSFETWNYGPYGTPGYYGVPFSVGIENFYYNKDLFTKAGITKTPETMDELYDVINKLKAADIIPWGVGAKQAWRAGHIHNYFLYKSVGVEKAIDLGLRKAKWTDPDVVQSLQMLKDLKAMGAFEDNLEAVDYDQEKANFLSGKYGMVLNGSWFVGDVIASDMKDKVGIFPFPYFSDKPQYKNLAVIFPQGFVLNGKATGAEKEAQILFMKHMTSQEWQEKMVKQIQRLSSRTDADLTGAELSDVFKSVVALLETVDSSGGDSFDYDPLPSMMDRTRNSIIGMLLGASAEDAAKEIQAEIDKK